MTTHVNLAVLVTVTVTFTAPTAFAQCEFFHDSLDSAASATSNGGTIYGSVGFAPAVNSNGAVFAGAGRIVYPNPAFDLDSGSISLWFKKNSTDIDGGILQIGTLGTPSSLGMFYVNSTDIRFEMRNAAGGLAAVGTNGVLSQTDWTHITAKWQDNGGGYDIWLYVDSEYVSYNYLSGTATHTTGQLDLGTTGYYGDAEGIIDEIRVFDWPLLDQEVRAEYVYSAGRFIWQPTGKPTSKGNVQLIDGNLHVGGRPFRAKGVGYAPTPIGETSCASACADPEVLARDMELLRNMNVNTIRLWGHLNAGPLLDACWNGGVDPIYVIMGYWVRLDPAADYSDSAVTDPMVAEFGTYVTTYKSHPAVLAWGIGNENNIAYQGDVADWFALAERLAAKAYEVEGEYYHPTIVVNGDLYYLGDTLYGSDDVSLGSVDMWGHNVYLGWDAHCYFDYYHRLSAKPPICTEFGIDAYDNRIGAEYQDDTHAEWVVRQWRQIKTNSQGGTIMAYSDEWWKAGDASTHDPGGYYSSSHPDGYSNEEWWGIMSVTSNGVGPDIMIPRPAYAALAAEFADVSGDYDSDGDTDLTDFAAFQSCYDSPATGPCTAFEFVVDGTIGLDDFVEFNACLNGPDRFPACPE